MLRINIVTVTRIVKIVNKMRRVALEKSNRPFNRTVMALSISLTPFFNAILSSSRVICTLFFIPHTLSNSMEKHHV